MAEDTIPKPTPAVPVGPNAPAVRAPVTSQPAGNDDRNADLARLAELQKEYLDLRDKTSQAAAVQSVVVDPAAAAHARKGDVVREMDAIKRKYRLS